MTYVQMVEKLGSDLGLQLNCSKLELICEDMITREAMLRAAPGVHVLSHDDADILGSRIRSMKHVGDVIQERSVQLHLMGDRLCLLQLHNALFLAFFLHLQDIVHPPNCPMFPFFLTLKPMIVFSDHF